MLHQFCSSVLCFLAERVCQSLAAARVIIDTDPGIDDAMAILLALNSPELKVEALTVVPGNVDGAAGTGECAEDGFARRTLRRCRSQAERSIR